MSFACISEACGVVRRGKQQPGRPVSPDRVAIKSICCHHLLQGLAYTITLQISFVNATGSWIGSPSISSAWWYSRFVYNASFSRSFA